MPSMQPPSHAVLTALLTLSLLQPQDLRTKKAILLTETQLDLT